jgi:hypothetical protein
MAKKKLIAKKVVFLHKFTGKGYRVKEYSAELYEKNKDAITKEGYYLLIEKVQPTQTEEIIEKIIEPLKQNLDEPTL